MGGEEIPRRYRLGADVLRGVAGAALGALLGGLLISLIEARSWTLPLGLGDALSNLPKVAGAIIGAVVGTGWALDSAAPEAAASGESTERLGPPLSTMGAVGVATALLLGGVVAGVTVERGGWTAAVPVPWLDSEREPDAEIDTEELLEEVACEEPQRLAHESLAMAEGDQTSTSGDGREVFIRPDFARRVWATTIQQFPHCFPAQKQVMAEVWLQSLD